MRLLATFIIGMSIGFQVAAAQPIVDRIAFQGLQKTQPDYLVQFLQSTPGSRYDSTTVATDEQSLRNLQYFEDVSSRLIREGEDTVLLFIVSERLTRLPITKFGGITDNFWLQLGLIDYHWLGRGNHFGGYYQYYDRHSFKIFQQLPQLFGRRWGMSYVLGRQATREPAYFSSGPVDFDVDRWEFTALGRFEVLRDLSTFRMAWIEAGGGYLNETYTPRSDALPDAVEAEQFDKLFLKTVFTHQQLRYFNHYLTGTTQQVGFEMVRTMGYNDSFFKALAMFHFYRKMGRANPALRIVAGLSGKDETPFVPFVLDSYLNVRGSGNRVARGTAELTANFEHRQTVFERRLWAVEGVAFLDVSAWRPAGASLADMFKRENVVSFAGGGFRLHLRRIYNFSLRVDYGISTSDASSRGFVLGVGQYF